MRFLVMIAISCAIVFGILKFSKRVKNTYTQQTITDEGLVKGSSGGGDAPFVGSTSQYLRAARPELQGEASMSLAFDPNCRAYVASLQALDLIALDRDNYKVSYQQLPVKPDNCAFGDPNLSAILGAIAAKCKPTMSQSETINDACAAALFMARAATTKQMYGQKVLSSISDMRVLTDLMFAEFASVNNSAMPDLKHAQAVAERMLELNPKLYVAAKIVAFAEVIKGINTKAGKRQMHPEEWAPAADAVARAKEINPGDPSLSDAEMLIATRGFEPMLAVDYGDQMITTNPSNAKGWYIKAYALWKMGDRPNALMNLKKAASLAPENKTYARTYIEASKPNARADAFQGSITFGVDSSDIDR